MKENKNKRTMSEYFDIGLANGALLMDASNLDWFTFPLFTCITLSASSAIPGL